MVDVECPPSAVDKATCQSVFGRFDLYVLDEDDAGVYETYVNATQSAIKGGTLQRTLEVVDPGSAFYIEGAGDPEKAAAAARGIPNHGLEGTKSKTESKNSIGLLGIIFITAGCSGVLVAIIAYSTVVPNKKRNELREKMKIEPQDSITEMELPNSADMQIADKSKEVEENEHRGEVLRLVERNCPDQLDNVDALLMQFSGREGLLIKTLTSMGKDEDGLISDDDDNSDDGDDSVESELDSVEPVVPQTNAQDEHGPKNLNKSEEEAADGNASLSQPKEIASDELSLDGDAPKNILDESGSNAEDYILLEDDKSLALSKVFNRNAFEESEVGSSQNNNSSLASESTTEENGAIRQDASKSNAQLDGERSEEQTGSKEVDEIATETAKVPSGEAGTIIEKMALDTNLQPSNGASVDLAGADVAPVEEELLYAADPIVGEGATIAPKETAAKLQLSDTKEIVDEVSESVDVPVDQAIDVPVDHSKHPGEKEVTASTAEADSTVDNKAEPTTNLPVGAAALEEQGKESAAAVHSGSESEDLGSDDEGAKAKVVWTKNEDGKSWTPSHLDNKGGSDIDSSGNEYDSSDDEDDNLDSKEGSGWIKAGKEWVQDFVTEEVDESDSSAHDSESSDVP